jgi:hypothetical protein
MEANKSKEEQDSASQSNECLAREARSTCNLMSDAERDFHFDLGMTIIYGSQPGVADAAKLHRS